MIVKKQKNRVLLQWLSGWNNTIGGFMKILLKDIKKELEVFGLTLNNIDALPIIEVFNKEHDWDGGYESGHGYDGAREEFYTDLNEIFSFLIELIDYVKLERCIIAPLHAYSYFEGWSDISKNDIYRILVKVLSEHQINIRTQCGLGLCLNEGKTILKRFVEGGFRYISRANLFLPEIGLIVQPWHHLNLKFISNDYKAIEQLISSLLPKYNNLSSWKEEEGYLS